jgi:outer membrane protein assembly factor BamB
MGISSAEMDLGPASVDGRVLIVASADGRVYGLEASSGKRLWVHATENANYADVVAAGKLALVACTSGHLYALDPTTGERSWTFEADAGLRAAAGGGVRKESFTSQAALGLCLH